MLEFTRMGAYFTIPSLCMKSFTLGSMIAQGTSGSVFSACSADQKCSFVVKFSPLVPYDFEREADGVARYQFGNEFERFDIDHYVAQLQHEHQMATYFGEQSIGPKILWTTICSGVFKVPNGKSKQPCKIGVMIMEAKQLTLLRYRKQFGTKHDLHILDLLLDKIKTMSNLGYVLYDTHAQNVMMDVSVSGEIESIYLIDFDRAKEVDAELSFKKSYELARRYFEDDGGGEL